MDDRAYWVGFNLVKGIGAVRLRALIDAFGDPMTAWQATADQLQKAGLSPKIIQTLIQLRQQVDLDRLWQQIQAQGITVLTWEDENYPSRLKEIDQPPPVLYVRGEIRPEDNWAVAIVGTRRITPYGRQVAEDVATFLAANGVTVVSGLARGVDAVAHRATLKAGGRTLAVLGSGVDNIYPPEHKPMAEEISRQGAVISDYPLGTPPESVNFPPRNRIISGLSQATVVVEAGETSGALITATFAVEQGREVFAVPGNILAPQSKGTNQLIQQGAHPLLNLQDLVDILHLRKADQQQTARKVLPADPTEARILHVLGHEPLHVDDIQAELGLPIEQVSATLTMMELKGMIRPVGGMNYVAVREVANFRYGESE